MSNLSESGNVDSRCTCERDVSPEERDDLFQWRGDPAWWSCVSCDGRVRPLTAKERAVETWYCAACGGTVPKSMTPETHERECEGDRL